MQLNYSKNNVNKYLLSILVGIGIIIIMTTFIGNDAVKTVTDLTYIPVTGTLVVLTSMIALRFGVLGNYGKAWILFLGFSVSWFIAQTVWTILELVYKISPFPSLADLFYVIGYPFLFGFLFYYLKPVRKSMTRNMLLAAISISIAMAVPSIYMTYSFDPKVSLLENALATFYPFADAIIFVPALIGIGLFFRGEVNFTWSFICIGIILQTIADTGFQAATYTNSYYTGHPVDIMFLWSYVFFSFGVLDHYQMFKTVKISKNFRK